jgi:glyoxylase I family protein
VPSYVLHHVGLSCDDPVAVEQWYTKHFGFRRRRVYAPGPDQVVMIEAGGVYLELFPSTMERPAPKVDGAGPDYSGFRHFAFHVNDLDTELARLGAGVRVTLGPVDMSQFIPGMRVAWVADPEGNIVELNQGYVDEEGPLSVPVEGSDPGRPNERRTDGVKNRSN